MGTQDKGTVTLRHATVDDGDAINRLCVEAYAEFRTVIGESNWRQLSKTLGASSQLINEGQLIVAEDGAGPVGVVLYKSCALSDNAGRSANSASMRTLAVSLSSRGRGIGRMLTQECIDRARREGADEISLTTAEMMTVARPMYERMGFVKEIELGQRFGVKHARYVLKLR
jgi:ribosomal protein S18 acetylase RimI-like enzyme